MRRRNLIRVVVLLTLSAFLGWRFVRPMNIFTVAKSFERPVATATLPAGIDNLRAESCGKCHAEFYDEWRTSMHAHAWTEPYFQVDWRHDRAQQICKNCHTPLDKQQEQRVLGFHDSDKFDPIVAPNPDFDPVLQQQGVTCAGCHVRDGKILGPYGNPKAPHPVRRMSDPNEICMPCHLVPGQRWDTFFRMPPCGTVAEIRAVDNSAPQNTRSMEATIGRTREVLVSPGELKCVACHMPAVDRPLTADGPVRAARRHLWRGGHDPAMVRQALQGQLERQPDIGHDTHITLTLTNVGAAHFLPTGTPDRHLSVALRLLDAQGHVLDSQQHILKRTLLWRPVIIDLRDTRLPRWQPRKFDYSFSRKRYPQATAVEAEVRYHLLTEQQRAKIGYQNTTPIDYPVYQARLPVTE